MSLARSRTRRLGVLGAITLAALGSACSSASRAPASAPYAEVEGEILETDAGLEAEQGDKRGSERPRIPLEINRSVQKWILYFTEKDHERFQEYLQRGSAFRPMVDRILKENGIPAEVYYLAMIESGYVSHARSSAKAVGPWQFMRGTGSLYGLKQNRYLDERRDIIRSTEAAARYLSGLYTAFQSWYLAMAAYNAGEGKILRAVIRGNTRDYWKLVESRALPPQTREYVPKLLAAAIIGRHPSKYGFKLEAGEPFPRVEPCEIPGGVRLSSVADRLEVPAGLLRALNPQLLRGITPPGSPYRIWVPEGTSKRAQLQIRTLAGSEPVRAARRPTRIHRVRPGEALSSIADQYGMTVQGLKRLNRLRSNRIQPGQLLRIRSSG